MDRRGLLKGLLAASVMYPVTQLSSGKKRSKSNMPRRLWIVLDGPFVIVLRRANPAVLEIFTPMTQRRIHAFVFNGVDNARSDELHAMTLNMTDTLELSGKLPDITDLCLALFSYKSQNEQEPKPIEGTDFVRLDNLPSPNRIFCKDCFRTQVEFDDGTSAWMYSGHVLEYKIKDTVKDPTKITMTDSLIGSKAAELVKCQDDTWQFTLQVGLYKNAGGVDPRLHAREFHNMLLKDRFPSLNDPSHSLRTVGKQQSFKNRKHRDHICPCERAMAVECNNGGFLVTQTR
jgi:hypothetical protein